MGTLIKLAQSGIVGVNEFLAQQIDTNTDASVPEELSVNYAYVFTGDIARSVKLPNPVTDLTTEAKIGSVIKIKNLMDIIDPLADVPKTKVLTIDRNGNNLDGKTDNVTIEDRNAIVEFIYINDGLGWVLV